MEQDLLLLILLFRKESKEKEINPNSCFSSTDESHVSRLRTDGCNYTCCVFVQFMKKNLVVSLGAKINRYVRTWSYSSVFPQRSCYMMNLSHCFLQCSVFFHCTFDYLCWGLLCGKCQQWLPKSPMFKIRPFIHTETAKYLQQYIKLAWLPTAKPFFAPYYFCIYVCAGLICMTEVVAWLAILKD